MTATQHTQARVHAPILREGPLSAVPDPAGCASLWLPCEGLQPKRGAYRERAAPLVHVRRSVRIMRGPL